MDCSFGRGVGCRLNAVSRAVGASSHCTARRELLIGQVSTVESHDRITFSTTTVAVAQREIERTSPVAARWSVLVSMDRMD